MTPVITLEYIVLSILLAIHISLCAVPLRSACTLYSEATNIQCLTASNVASNLGQSPNLWLLEFYSSHCGHCISFAPTFQRLSNSVKEWSRFVRLGVLDCAPSVNRATCQQFKINYFPCFKSISPLSDVVADKVSPVRRDIPSLTNLITDLIIENTDKYNEETRDFIQQLESLSCDLDWDTYFDSNRDVLILFIAELAGSYTGKHIMFDVAEQMIHRKDIKIRRLIVSETSDCSLMNILTPPDDMLHLLFFRNATLTLQYHSNLDDVRAHYSFIINRILMTSLSVTTMTDTELEDSVRLPISKTDLGREEQDLNLVPGEVIFNRVRHGFTTSDVINSVSYSLRNEVSFKEQISGEDINALLRYLELLDHILPQIHQKTKFLLSSLIQELSRFKNSPNHVVTHSLSGREWDLLVNEKLDRTVFPINSRWVGCRGSKPYLRGYTCGIWVLFHLSLTHVSLETDKDRDFSAVDVAKIIKEYVVRFFSCSDCKLHFGRMASRLELEIATDREAVMWFWIAHNKINKRLQDDPSTDTRAPKVQFPPLDICPDCRFTAPIRDTTSEVFSLNGVTWNTTEVYIFLLSYYNRHRKENFRKSVLYEENHKLICYSIYAVLILLLFFFIRKICHRKQKILGRFKQV